MVFNFPDLIFGAISFHILANLSDFSTLSAPVSPKYKTACLLFSTKIAELFNGFTWLNSKTVPVKFVLHMENTFPISA